MSDETKIPVTVADHVAGYKRFPNEKPQYYAPFLMALAVSVLLGFAMIIGNLIIVGLLNIFWFPELGDRLLNWGNEEGGLIAARIVILTALAIVLVGTIVVAINRQRDK